MKTFFIEQSKRTGVIISKLQKVSLKGNKIIINTNLKRAKFKTKVKISKTIMQILAREKSRQIVLEEDLKNDKELVNLLNGYNINICNPKWLFKQLTNEVLKKDMKDKKREDSEIWICVNEIDTVIEKNIYQLAKEFRRVNIITNHIGKFKKIEEKLYNEDGILINLSNNKRKSLAKADLILNLDFPKELINQFVIFDRADIIDIEGNISIRKKRFNGRIINDYRIELEDDSEIAKFIKENKLENYDVRDICQVIEKVPKKLEI